MITRLAVFTAVVLVVIIVVGVCDYRAREAAKAESDAFNRGYAAGLMLLEAYPVEDLIRLLDSIETAHKPDAFARGLRAATRGRK